MSVKFRWHGSEYAARIIGEGTKGRTLVEALEHGPRFSIGSTVEVTNSELILPFDTSTPPTPNEPAAMEAAMNAEVTVQSAADDTSYADVPPEQIAAMNAYARGDGPSADALQKAMDDERKTLPTVAEVLANPNPTPPLSASSQAAAQITKETPMSDVSAVFSRIQEKAKIAAGATAEVAAAVEGTLDDVIARRDELLKRNETVHAAHARVIQDAHAGLDVMEGALRQISNGGPA